MKKSFLYLGIVVLIFTNFSRASNFTDCKTDVEQKYSATIDDNTILNPESIIQGNYNKTIDQIIAEDNLITESAVSTEEPLLIYSEKRIEEIIAENNLIIENKSIKNETLLYLEKSIQEIIVENNKITESKASVEAELLYLSKPIEEVVVEDSKIIESKIVREAQSLDFEKINGRLLPLKSINSNVFVGMN
jgi:hypothetical protein